MSIFIPKSCDFYPPTCNRKSKRELDVLGRITNRGEVNRGFLLSNRVWQEIDGPFGQLVSRTINVLVPTSDDEPVRVLDLGAGAKARAANELQTTKKLGKKVFVTALDLTYSTPAGEAQQICADMRQIPLADDSIDIAYSRQSFCYLADKGIAPAQKTISEIERDLKPGGVFFTDQHIHNYQNLEVGKSDFLHGHSPYFGKLLSFVFKQASEWDYDTQFYMLIKKGGSGTVKTFLQKQDGVHPIAKHTPISS